MLAAYDLWKVAGIAYGQLRGPAEGTDFLNLYAGARLFVADPSATYDQASQLALQRSLTERASELVPFYLPPYAAVVVSWLGSLSYGVAYLVWMGVSVACLMLAAYWLAPSWSPWNVIAWRALMLLFLPCLLGVAQGQTSALALACTAGLVGGMLDQQRSAARPGLGLFGLALKPQLAPLFVCALVIARAWRALAFATVVLAIFGAAGWLRIGSAGQAAFSAVSNQKLVETFTADPTFLLGPTLLHAARWYLGNGPAALVVWLILEVATLALVAWVWRSGFGAGDERLLQLAMLPIAAVLISPYALIYELTGWLVSFWLVWRYTRHRPPLRAGLLWLTASVWVAGDVGVALPLAGGADAAALLGLVALGCMGWLYRLHAVTEPKPAPAACANLT